MQWELSLGSPENLMNRRSELWCCLPMLIIGLHGDNPHSCRQGSFLEAINANHPSHFVYSLHASVEVGLAALRKFKLVTSYV